MAQSWTVEVVEETLRRADRRIAHWQALSGNFADRVVEVADPDGVVRVTATVAGLLQSIAISEYARRHYDAAELSEVVTRTVGDAQRAGQEAAWLDPVAPSPG